MPTSATAAAGHNNGPTAEQLLLEKHKPLFERTKKWLRAASKANLEPKTMEDCAALDVLVADGRDLVNDGDSARTKEKEPSLREGQMIDELFNKGIRDVVGVKAKDGLAARISQASADRKLAIAHAAQAKAAQEEEALRVKANAAAEKAKALEDAGNTKMADKANNQVEALDRAADQAGAQASASVAQISKTTVGGVTSSVSAKMVCDGIVNRWKLDMQLVLPFIPEPALIAAVDAFLKANPSVTAVAGAAVKEQATNRVRR